MTNHSKLSDRELDVEVAKALGIKVVMGTCPEELCAYNEIDGSASKILDYSTSWQYAGPLLELMVCPSLRRESGGQWFCAGVFGTKILGSFVATADSSTRAVCLALLKWRDADPEGFKKAVNSRLTT